MNLRFWYILVFPLFGMHLGCKGQDPPATADLKKETRTTTLYATSSDPDFSYFTFLGSPEKIGLTITPAFKKVNALNSTRRQYPVNILKAYMSIVDETWVNAVFKGGSSTYELPVTAEIASLRSPNESLFLTKELHFIFQGSEVKIFEARYDDGNGNTFMEKLLMMKLEDGWWMIEPEKMDNGFLKSLCEIAIEIDLGILYDLIYFDRQKITQKYQPAQSRILFAINDELRPFYIPQTYFGLDLKSFVHQVLQWEKDTAASQEKIFIQFLFPNQVK